MLAFLGQGGATLLVALVVFGTVAAILLHSARRARRARKGGCGHGCAGCAYAGSCHPRPPA